MPPPYVTTIRDEIFYEYAKLISRSAFGELNRAFITDRFKKLRDGNIIQWSDISKTTPASSQSERYSLYYQT